MTEKDSRYKIVAKCFEKIPLKERFAMKEFGFIIEKGYDEEPKWKEEQRKLYGEVESMIEEIKIKEKIKMEG